VLLQNAGFVDVHFEDGKNRKLSLAVLYEKKLTE